MDCTSSQTTEWESIIGIKTQIITDEIIWPYSIGIAMTSSMRSVYDKQQAVEEPREGSNFQARFEDQQGGDCPAESNDLVNEPSATLRTWCLARASRMGTCTPQTKLSFARRAKGEPLR
jgi:hypothetical protein